MLKSQIRDFYRPFGKSTPTVDDVIRGMDDDDADISGFKF
jgi:hypothetical protein